VQLEQPEPVELRSCQLPPIISEVYVETLLRESVNCEVVVRLKSLPGPVTPPTNTIR
jgi:hypothetical protein